MHQTMATNSNPEEEQCRDGYEHFEANADGQRSAVGYSNQQSSESYATATEAPKVSTAKSRTRGHDIKTNVETADQGNSEREDLHTPLLRRSSVNSYDSIGASSSASQTQDPNPESSQPPQSPRYRILDEDDLRKKLQEFLNTPRQQWIKKRMISRYAFWQTVKTIIVSVLILIFGRVVFDHIDFMSNSEEALRHLYFENWNNLLYTKAYALYSKPVFFNHIDYVLTQFNRTPELSVGPYEFKMSDGIHPDPPKMHITYYPHLNLYPSEAKYHFYGSSTTDVFYVYPVNKTDPETHQTRKEYDTKVFLEEHNKTLRFDNTSEILLELHLTAIFVGSWTQITKRSKDAFECYDFTVWITYENSNDNGQLTVDLRIDDHQRPCNNQNTDPTSLLGLPFFCCLIVFFLSFLSLGFVSAKVYRTWILKQVTKLYFEKRKNIDLDDKELRIFINLWDRMIIVSDLLLMTGCVMQFLLTLVKSTRKDDTFDYCSMLLGTGCLLSWISLIRDLDIMSRNCNIMILTLQKALYPRIVSFLGCVALLYIGFLLCGWLVLGPYLDKFNSLSVTSETIFSLINGDDVFSTFKLLDSVPTRVRVYGQIYLYIYICIFIYVVVNVCISILTDAYEEIRGFYEKGFPKTAIEKFVEEDDGPGLREKDPKMGCLYPVLKYCCPVKEEKDLNEWRENASRAGSLVI